MNVQTRSGTIAASPKRVFAYLADPMNLPHWARAFASAIRTDGDDLIATSASGELRFKLVTHEACGTIDFVVAVAPGFNFVAPTRVVANGVGSEYLFTQFQPPGMSDEEFAGRVDALTDEFATLRRVLETPG